MCTLVAMDMARTFVDGIKISGQGVLALYKILSRNRMEMTCGTTCHMFVCIKKAKV